MKIKVGSIIEVSTIDVLFNNSCVLFFSGCNFRCPWCQNAPLVYGEGKEYDINDILTKIKDNFLVDYIQANGGEPTLQEKALICLFEKVKNLNKKTSLATNGSNPSVIKKLVDCELIDHLALDVKSSFENYKKVCGVDVDVKKIEKTIKLSRDIEFVEVRTTVVPNCINESEIYKIIDILQSYLDNKFYYVLQQFYPSNMILDEKYRNMKPTSVKYLIKLGNSLKAKGIKVFIRSKEKGIIEI